MAKQEAENTQKSTQKKHKLTPEMEAAKWKKGDPSPNPGGRPKKLPYQEAAMLVGKMTVEQLKINKDDTVAVALAKSICKEAIFKGKIPAAKEVADRAEGKPIERLRISGDEDNDTPVTVESAEGKNLDEIRESLGAIVKRFRDRKLKP